MRLEQIAGAHTLSFVCAPHEHAQHRCRRVLSVAYPSILTVADIKVDVGATRDILTEISPPPTFYSLPRFR